MDDKSHIHSNNEIEGLQPAGTEPLVISSQPSPTLESRCDEMIAKMLAKPPSVDELMDVMGIRMVRERYDLGQKLDQVMEMLDDPLKCAVVYKDFSEVKYKYDKTLMQFHENRNRLHQTKARTEPRAKATKRTLPKATSGLKAIRKKPR